MEVCDLEHSSSLRSFTHLISYLLWTQLSVRVVKVSLRLLLHSISQIWQMRLQTLQIIPPPRHSGTQDTRICTPAKKSLWPVKDIHDFDRVHGDWLEHAAVTLVVHHHHEEVAAGDLLDDEGPVNHSRRQRRGRKEGRKKKEKCEQACQADGG